jgi:signal peptide peptidase SppA
MAIEPRALARTWGPRAGFFDQQPEEDHEGCCFQLLGSVAVVTIDGPIERRGGWWYDGFESVSTRFARALADERVQSVLLRINSPGGVVSGCFETARRMRAAAAQAGKPVVAYADESAYSAAYALASVAEKIVLPASGGVGSVGVIQTLYDESKANELMGLRVEVVTSGERKADGHPDVPLTKDVIARVEARVEQLAQLFAELVAEHRPGMTAASVRALQAACLYGADAVAKGLADQVGTLESAIALCLQLSAGRGPDPIEVNRMKAINATLGLPEAASEGEACAAIAAHQQLVTATGKATPSEARGQIEAWKASASRAEQLSARVAELEAKAEQGEREALIKQAEEEGRLPPGNEALHALARELPLAAARTMLAALPKLVKTRAVATGAKTPITASLAGANGLTAEEERLCASAGVTPEEFLARKNARAKAQKSPAAESADEQE